MKLANIVLNSSNEQQSRELLWWLEMCIMSNFLDDLAEPAVFFSIWTVTLLAAATFHNIVSSNPLQMCTSSPR